MSNTVPVTKSDDEEPVPTIWRDTFRQIVEAFRSGDFSLRAIDGVAPLSDDDDASAIKRSIASYGDGLASLPDESWKTSIARWTGSHWDVLVDLFTESGLSDLVISSRVREEGGGYHFIMDSVHVP